LKIKQLYDDFNVPYATEDSGHRHGRPGWINTECPFCIGNPGYHLGFNTDGNYFYCWRCGPHSTKKVLSKLLTLDEKAITPIIKQYGGSDGRIHPRLKRSESTTKPFSLPSGCGPMQRVHEQYLLSRGFDPDQLEYEWNLLGTGPVSSLDGAEYKHRIIAPIEWYGNTVSFQGRDITDLHRLKYKTCSKEREVIHHKEILYGNQEHWTKTGIIVEGITDVWRFGPTTAATFGIEFTYYQVRAISKAFERVFIIYDNETQAQIQAQKLKRDLKEYYRDPQIEIIAVEGDPGGLKQTDADYLVKQLINQQS